MGNSVATMAYKVKSMAVQPLRVGRRNLLWAPDYGLGFGNFLYLWLHADIEQNAGRDYRVLATPAMERWLTAFPLIRDQLTVNPDKVRIWDRREWPRDTLFQSFGTEYTRDQLHGFIKKFLAPGLRMDTQVDGTVVVNIRRGDYYSVPHFRNMYGFNIAGYLQAAMHAATSREKITQVLVVSDDPAWCRENLDPILRMRSTGVEYAPVTAGPLANFQAVSTTRRLIGTNSTFSYWGGYIADVLHSDAHVVMPEFHARWEDDPSAYQLDPTWDIIATVPGGWEEAV